MPYYCFLCPSILLCLMIREKRRKKLQLISISNTTSEESAEVLFMKKMKQYYPFRIFFFAIIIIQGYFSALNLQWESRRKTIDVCPQFPMKRLDKIRKHS